MMFTFGIQFKNQLCYYQFGFYICPLVLEATDTKVFVLKKNDVTKKVIAENLDKEIVDCPAKIREAPDIGVTSLIVKGFTDSYVHLQGIVKRKHSGNNPKGESSSFYDLFYLNRPSMDLKLFAYIRRGMCYSLCDKDAPESFDINKFKTQEGCVADVKWGFPTVSGVGV